MALAKIKKIARLIFEKTRNEIWLAGKGLNDSRGKQIWPLTFNPTTIRRHSMVWTLSPPIQAAGHELRVCVVTPDGIKYTVYVLTGDGQIQHPGGQYESNGDFWFWPTWAGTLAHREWLEGGKTSHVDRFDAVIEALESRGPKLIASNPEANNPLRTRAELEVEAHLKKIGG